MKGLMNRKKMRIFLNCGPVIVFLLSCGPHRVEFDMPVVDHKVKKLKKFNKAKETR
jgi:hypothetical protein